MESTIDQFKDYVQKDTVAYSPDLRIASIPIFAEVSFDMVYRTDSHKIIQGYFNGVKTDLFLELDGETKSGNEEYETIVHSIISGELEKLLHNLPARLVLSDGKTEARFWK